MRLKSPHSESRGKQMSKLRQVLTAATVAALVASGLTSCDSEGAEVGDKGGGDLRVTVTSFPDYVDPQLSYTVQGWEVLWNAYTPLLTYKHVEGDAGTEVVPGLAEDMPQISEDGKTYTLKLRSNMKYSDGTPIKASDFTYAIQRLFKADSGGSVFYEDIVGAKDYADDSADTISGITTDDSTGDITIELESPNGTFSNVLGLMFAAPVPPTTPLDEDATNTPPPASGPFMISNVDAPRTLTMERNPEFKTVKDAGASDVPDAYADTITVSQNKSNSAQVTGVIQNNIDFMSDPPDPDRLTELQANYANRFRLEDSINTYYFWMNTRNTPFNDLKVRQAVNYAVDPEALNRVFGNRLHPTQQILPPGMPGYAEFALYPGPDMAKAKQLLAEANPSDKDITVWTDDEPVHQRIGEYYQDLLTQLGFNVQLQVLAGGVYFTTIGNTSTPNLDTGFADWFQDFPHPDDFFRPLLNGEAILPTNNSNYSQVAIPEYDAAMDELRQQQLTDGVKKQYAALDRAYMQQAALAPFGNEQYATFVSDRIDFDSAYYHLLFGQDFSTLRIK